MLTPTELDILIEQGYLIKLARPLRTCLQHFKEKNIYIYEFGTDLKGLYMECEDCVKSDKRDLQNTIIRPILEQELFYLRIHMK